MPMNDLDSLFESVRGSAIADVIRDSKIILVTEFDAVHPLKTGEFWFEEEENTLYVGAGQMMSNDIFYLGQLLNHSVSYIHIEAPRIRTNHRIELDIPIHSSSFLYVPANRIRINNAPKFDSTLTVTSIRKVVHNFVEINGVRDISVSLNSNIKGV